MKTPVILTALGDNYIYLLEYASGKALTVDPGDASVVKTALSRQHLTLTHILVTHHHADHIGGIGQLKKRFNCEIISPDRKRISETDTILKDTEEIVIGDLKVRVIATPGHTTTSVCYFVTGPESESPLLFTGDTLFVCGCGRLFECAAETMFASFRKLTALSDETLVYPGHNYTEENIRFALTVEPDSLPLKQKLAEIGQKTRNHQSTVPSTLAEEKQLNPFLKATTATQFAQLRQEKDFF